MKKKIGRIMIFIIVLVALLCVLGCGGGSSTSTTSTTSTVTCPSCGKQVSSLVTDKTAGGETHSWCSSCWRDYKKLSPYK